MTEKTDEPEVVVVPDDPVTCCLLKAADIVEQRWTRGRFGDPGGEVCALGAIGEVVNGRPTSGWRESVGMAAANRLAKVVGLPGGTHVPNWNDRHARSREQVAAAMRKAARLKD